MAHVVYNSPEEAFDALEELYCSCDVAHVRRIPSHIVKQILVQCGYEMPEGRFSLNLSKCKRLGLPGQYLGNAGAVALAVFVKNHLSCLELLTLDGAIVEVGLTNPSTISADAALQHVLETLQGFPLRSLDLSNIPLGARGYRLLTQFLKLTPCVVSLKASSCRLNESELRGLDVYLSHNRTKKQSGTAREDVIAVANGVPSAGRPQSFYFSDRELRDLLGRPPIKDLGLYDAMSALNAQDRQAAGCQDNVKSLLKLSVIEGFRERPKDNLTRERLVALLLKVPSVEAMFRQCFPKSSSESMSATGGSGAESELREALGVGPSLNEEEASRRLTIQMEQQTLILDFIANSLQCALCKHGDKLIEAGDTAHWVSFIESPADASLYVSKDSEQVAQFPSGCFVGEHEILSRMNSRVYDVVVDSPRSEPVVVWQISKEIYSKLLMPFVLDQRRLTRKAVETVPQLGSISHVARLSLCHALQPFQVDIGVLNEATQARDAIRMSRDDRAPDPQYRSFPLMKNSDLLGCIIFVEEGTVILRKGIADLKEFSRGGVVFVEEDLTDVGAVSNASGMSLVSAPIKQSHVRLQVMPRESLAKLPDELRLAIQKTASTFSVLM